MICCFDDFYLIDDNLFIIAPPVDVDGIHEPISGSPKPKCGIYIWTQET